MQTIKIKYSKVAHNLDKLFKNYSLETFKKNINNPKKYILREFQIDDKKMDNIDN